MVQNNLEMNKKEQQAIDFLRSMERDDPMCLGFSGGKDSVVIFDLAERSGIKYNADYEIDDNGEVVPSLRQLDYNGGMSAIPLFVNLKKDIIELV